VAPPSSTKSRPGRALAVLAALLIVMLVGILGKDTFQPAKWQSNFRVQLGLDLSSGTTVTLKAVTVHNTQPSAAAMTTAIAIMNSRVNGAGFTGAVVQQQGSNVITVAVPGKGGAQVVKLVGTTAQLRFRQVLLEAGNTSLAAPAPTPTPSASSSPSPSPSASPSAKASSSAKVSPTPSSSAAAIGAPGAASGGHGLSSAARQLAARPGAAASAKPTSSASPAASASPSPSATTAPATKLSTTADAQGDAALVSAPVKALFDKLNCADPNWQQKIYNGDPTKWDDVNSQVVSCEKINGVLVKYALNKASVVGTMVTAATATLSTTNSSWQVNISFNGAGTTAFGNLTTSMFDNYGNNGNPTSPLDQLAVVLDGNIVSSPNVISPSTAGQTMITGSFNEKQATLLANQLSYGHLPLTFKNQSTDSISPELGSSQLHAGLVAAGIGLLLVVLYSFLYYRGLGLVSVSSLIIAALLSYLSVVLLSKYQGYSLSLSGVAGLIVAIGITADSFVVFFERLRDEVRDGRSLRAAVERGWQRARRTILVSDTVSFLAALMLWYFSIDDVKGFAFTLGLTTMIDIIVVFLFTKPMVTLLARTRFYGNGHPLSGLDPARLGARTPWRGAKRVTARPATSGAAGATARPQARTTPKEA
jgi:preprotein translocase subunit SecD